MKNILELKGFSCLFTNKWVGLNSLAVDLAYGDEDEDEANQDGGLDTPMKYGIEKFHCTLLLGKNLDDPECEDVNTIVALVNGELGSLLIGSPNPLSTNGHRLADNFGQDTFGALVQIALLLQIQDGFDPFFEHHKPYLDVAIISAEQHQQGGRRMRFSIKNKNGLHKLRPVFMHPVAPPEKFKEYRGNLEGWAKRVKEVRDGVRFHLQSIQDTGDEIRRFSSYYELARQMFGCNVETVAKTLSFVDLDFNHYAGSQKNFKEESVGVVDKFNGLSEKIDDEIRNCFSTIAQKNHLKNKGNAEEILLFSAEKIFKILTHDFALFLLPFSHKARQLVDLRSPYQKSLQAALREHDQWKGKLSTPLQVDYGYSVTSIFKNGNRDHDYIPGGPCNHKQGKPTNYSQPCLMQTKFSERLDDQ